MTRTQWAKLTDEEKRIKVAELCGWTDIVLYDGYWWGTRHWPTGESASGCEIPNYLNDLNAMHKAVIAANTSQAFNYDGPVVKGLPRSFVQWLDEIIHPEQFYAECEKSTLALITATAAQLAEAFVLTMEGEDE